MSSHHHRWNTFPCLSVKQIHSTKRLTKPFSICYQHMPLARRPPILPTLSLGMFARRLHLLDETTYNGARKNHLVLHLVHSLRIVLPALWG